MTKSFYLHMFLGKTVSADMLVEMSIFVPVRIEFHGHQATFSGSIFDLLWILMGDDTIIPQRIRNM